MSAHFNYISVQVLTNQTNVCLLKMFCYTQQWGEIQCTWDILEYKVIKT